MALEPPRAARRPHARSEHGDERVDDWYWLRERDNPEVIAYLEAENAYANEVLAPTADLRERIFQEIKGRVQETDESAPVPYGPWEYTSRTVEGLQYEIHHRRPREMSADSSEVLIDENALAEGHEYFALGGFEISPDHNVLAYSTDVTGAEEYTLRFRDLANGVDLPDVVDNVIYGLAWADDSQTCLYVRTDDTHRPCEGWRHALGTAPHDDVLVLREDDEKFNVGIERTRSGRFIIIDAASRTTTEVWAIPTDDIDAPPLSVGGRESGHEYAVEHHWSEERGDRFLIVTNQGGKARNFELVAAPCVDPARQYWTPIVPHRPDVKLDAVTAFSEHVVLSERADGLERLRVLRVEGGDEHEIETSDPVYSIWVGSNDEYDTRTLRFGYTSLVTPVTDYDYDMETRNRALVRRQPVLGGYNPDDYVCERLWATASEGVRVPISLVRRRDTPVDGTAPAELYGYGAYEISIEAGFRISLLSLLDRGFVYAIAHVRGGGEMGRAWYDSGRLEHKTNTFTDFIACAEELIARGYTRPDRLGARGESAGGLLMGAIANMRPDLFAAIVAEVPAVDLLNTMLDPSIPLTTNEYEEWGDPRRPDAYQWIRAYSPYDNVRAVDYPSLLVTCGLHDPRVQYWEPAKWVAKLRTLNTSSRPPLLRTEIAGHDGPSGRYDAWRSLALTLAFMCSSIGVEQ
jgi:oligopeptidase B